ncbi:MAG: hypothetical protein NT041_02490 [Candidatus Vogelbacteria bacterium]|nr:hypothetical protein [Candidatus Vogelbacteria bacterium]
MLEMVGEDFVLRNVSISLLKGENGTSAMFAGKRFTEHLAVWKIQKVENIFVANLAKQNGEIKNLVEIKVNYGKMASQLIEK